MPASRAATREIVNVFREAMRLEREALDAYSAAIVRLGEEPLTRDTAMSFLSAHERHVDELDSRLGALGALASRARREGDDESPRRLLPPERFADANGTTAELRMLKANSDELVRRYRLLMSRSLPEESVAVIRRICNDELRHRAWLAARIAAFSRAERRSSPPSSSRSTEEGRHSAPPR